MGAGITGCSIAWHLARRGEKSCLVDPGGVAAGASGRNAGFLLAGTSENYAEACRVHGRELARQLWRYSNENHRALAEAGMLDDSVGYRKCGSLLLESCDAGVAALRESAELLAEDGFSAGLLGAAEREKESGSNHFGEALLSPEDGCVDPVRLVNRLAAASGAQRVTGAIESVEAVEGGVLAQGPVLEIRAKRAFLALNAWSSQVAPELAQWTRPKRAQMLATDPLPPLWNRVIYADSGYQYLRQLPDGTCLVGGGRREFADEEVGLEPHVHAKVHEFLERYVRERFPALREMQVTQRWAGTMAFSPDGVPVIGELSRAPGTWFLGGYTGHGMGFAFRLSRMLVEHVLEGGGMGPLGAERFS